MTGQTRGRGRRRRRRLIDYTQYFWNYIRSLLHTHAFFLLSQAGHPPHQTTKSPWPNVKEFRADQKTKDIGLYEQSPKQ